ncbi:MAG: tetratricopeptide repeat protein [Phycisphaerae bacterium]|nr:tetratricopeptide repeat protein [Phycisphaerae bacterium]
MRRVVTTAILMLGLIHGASAGEEPSAGDRVRQGNSALLSGKYDEALKAYDQAEVTLPESPQIQYNRGLAQYRKRDFVKAKELFSEALSTRDLRLEAAAHFNLGNCAYSQALEKLKSYDEAIELAQEAIRCYRRALELSPEDVDARTNIETARLLIKQLQDEKKKKEEERKKKEEEEKKKQQPQSQPSSQPQSQPSSQPQSQPSSRPESQPTSQPEQQKGDQDKKQQEQQKQGENAKQKQQQQEKGAARPEEQKLNKEEAQRILQAVRDRERQRRQEQAQKRAGGRILVDRDW